MAPVLRHKQVADRRADTGRQAPVQRVHLSLL